MTARPSGEAVKLAVLPTPLDDAPRLTAALGGPRILVKRDDLTGLALGGNKARKLELLGAQARREGADVLVTGGGIQSNHARMTAAAANRLGLDCHLVLAGPEPEPSSGNLLLDRLLGATIEFGASSRYALLERAIVDAAARLEAAGRRPFAIPVGGASVTGVIAYADAVDELRAQLDATRVAIPDWIVVADGSGGTHAGLLAGLAAAPIRVVGVDVGTRPDLDDAVPRLAIEAAAASGRVRPTADVIIDHAHFGAGYGELSAAATEAITIAARTEGLVLDPVYTGKAMAALITHVRDGRFRADETVVFWHTGGAPALFDPRYAACLEDTGRNVRTTLTRMTPGSPGVIQQSQHSSTRRGPCGQPRRREQQAPTAARASSRCPPRRAGPAHCTSPQQPQPACANPSGMITAEVNGVWWPPSSSTRVGRAIPVRWVRFLPPPPL